MLPLLIGAGVGYAKYRTDREQEKRDRAAAAETARYSPWTGMKPGDVKHADLLGSVLQGGTTGAMLGQGMDSADSADALNQSQIANQNAQASYFGGQAMQGQPDLYQQQGMQPSGSAGNLGGTGNAQASNGYFGMQPRRGYNLGVSR